MKALKKLVIGIVAAAVMMSSAAAAFADETTAPTQAQGTGESTTSTFDISKLSFDTMYGNQLPDFLNHEYMYNGEKIPVVESNYYFLLTFLQLSQYAAYGYYPATSAGYLDLAATYKDGDKEKTYAEYFVKQAEDYLYSTCIFVERAKAAGIKLTDEDKKAIEDEVNDRIEQQAKPAGVSLDVILKLYFGPQCDEKAYRSLLENATLAGKYSEKYVKDYKIPDDKLLVPNVRYALFYAPGATASDDEKKKAETAANDLLKKCKNLEDLKTQAEALQKAGSVYDQGTLSVPKGKMVSAFEEWAYGASRKEGEMGVILSKEYGYFVVGYMGKVKLDEEEQEQIANDAMNAEIEKEMKENKHNFHTDQKYGPAKAAPTAVPAPTDAPNAPDSSLPNGETAPTALPTESGVTPADNGMSNVLIIVFVAIGGVAIVAVIIILVTNSRNSDKDDSSSKGSSSKKSSKKVIEEEEEEDEEEYGDDGEEEEPEEQADPYSGISDDEEEEEESSKKKKN